MIRLRQVVLVAAELDPVVTAVGDALDVTVCYRDPGVAEFGLVNALMAIGDDFLEVVSPDKSGTTAGRLLDKRGGDGGYMVIVQCDDLERRRAWVKDLGVRVIWRSDMPDIRGTHLHPKDVGGAILSIDEAHPPSSWRWAGSDWPAFVRTSTVTGIAGVTIGADDPTAMAARWAEVLERPLRDECTVTLDHDVIRFVPAGPRGEGLDGIDIGAADPTRAGETISVGGVTLSLV
jgi:hypothetical protein